MSLRKTNFVEGEYYHIYNRGVDKRTIFNNKDDVSRFLQSISEFNRKETIGSIYEKSFRKEDAKKYERLVSFTAYSLIPNHYHFILTPLVEKGIEFFMQRLGTGYTMYFNNRYERSGSLFQGKFKASHIDSNEYLLHVSAYVNLNDKSHQLGGKASKLVRTSWEEYLHNDVAPRCDKEIILDQFKDINEYRSFCLNSLQDMIARKEQEKELRELLLD